MPYWVVGFQICSILHLHAQLTWLLAIPSIIEQHIPAHDENKVAFPICPLPLCTTPRVSWFHNSSSVFLVFTEMFFNIYWDPCEQCSMNKRVFCVDCFVFPLWSSCWHNYFFSFMDRVDVQRTSRVRVSSSVGLIWVVSSWFVQRFVSVQRTSLSHVFSRTLLLRVFSFACSAVCVCSLENFAVACILKRTLRLHEVCSVSFLSSPYVPKAF